MQSEIFQDQLWNFSTAYFTSSRYEVASEDMSQFLKDVSETATENDVHIFSQYNEINNKYLSTLHIYGDDKVIRQTLKNTANIEESEYTALVSGITKVKFHNLSELQSTSVGYENFISYIGNEDNIISAYQKLSEKYSLTYPEYWNSTEKDMIFIIWGMIIALMIVLNVIEVVRRKKEVVVRVSLGESAGFIAFKAALFDVTFDIALFIVAKILLSNYISGAYENRLVTILYSIGIILSTIPYCSFCFFDIRKAFANATHKRGVDFLIYSLKFIAGVAAVFTITTNISSIHNNLFTNEHLLEEYYDANYFTVKTTDFNAEKEEAFWNKLYKNEYNTLKPVICLNILNDKNDVIYVNNHAKDMLQGFTKQINAVENESSDLIIFIPKNRYFAKNKQLAYDSLSHVLNHDNLQQLNIQYIEYSETEYFSYLDTSRINGIEKSKNPIIIYQANKDLAVNGGYLESYKAGAVLFQCDEKQLRNISKKYEDMLGNYQLVITNVHEQYLYNHTFLIKLVGFLSSLCTIVLLLNIMIIVTVSRLEFRENAMKISLMKIFGYSLFERHKTLLKMIVVENFVILVGMLIYSLLSVQTEVGISILVSSFMADREKSILDMCTGSGCIALSLALMGGYRHVAALDVSAKALKVAEQNRDRLLGGYQGVFELIRSDMFCALEPDRTFDIIVSNPPYIPSRVIEDLEPEVRDHEPRIALDGSADGLTFYRILAEEGQNHLTKGGSIYMEIGYDQSEAVEGLFVSRGYRDVRTFKDLAGQDRVVRAVR